MTRPNILFLLADQHRHDWISANASFQGHGLLNTPNLDWLAAGGTRIRNCLVASPVCGPSRACLASGVFYGKCGMIRHETDWPCAQMDSIYRRLRDDAGYHVLGSGKFDLNKATVTSTRKPGPDGKALLADWGFSDGINNMGKWDAFNSATADVDPWYRYLSANNLEDAHQADYARRVSGQDRRNYTFTDPTPLPDHAYADNWLTRNARDLITSVPSGQPWFCQVNFNGPHEPLDITSSMDSDREGYPLPSDHSSDITNHNAIRRNYSAMIENIDAQIGMLISFLRESGQLEKTILIYSSDHGEMLGDHNRWAKSCPYQQSVAVPLVVRGPGVQAGTVSDALVSLIDIGATALELAGLDIPAEMESRSLWPVLQGKTATHRETVVSGLGDWRMVFDGRFKLITGFTPSGVAAGAEPPGGPLLFDLHMDPEECVNVIAAHPGRAAALESLL